MPPRATLEIVPATRTPGLTLIVDIALLGGSSMEDWLRTTSSPQSSDNAKFGPTNFGSPQPKPRLATSIINTLRQILVNAMLQHRLTRTDRSSPTAFTNIHFLHFV